MFYGRETELKRLTELLKKPTASLVVLKGRRRIGKSSLVEEFSKQFTHYYSFTGHPPEHTQKKDYQKTIFLKKLQKYIGGPKIVSKTSISNDLIRGMKVELIEEPSAPNNHVTQILFQNDNLTYILQANYGSPLPPNIKGVELHEENDLENIFNTFKFNNN